MLTVIILLALLTAIIIYTKRSKQENTITAESESLVEIEPIIEKLPEPVVEQTTVPEVVVQKKKRKYNKKKASKKMDAKKA